MTPGINWNPTDEYVERVKRAYRHALRSAGKPPIFSIWRAIGKLQHDVHAALMEDDNDTIRSMFGNPASTDLFYGADNLCRSVTIEMTVDSHVGLQQQARALFAKAELRGHNLSFPNPFAGESGYQTDNGVATYRAILSAVQALRIKEVATGPVIEIGPGLGRVALHARQIGITDYTTVDIPMGLVAQSCFLGATIGPDAVWFSTDRFSSEGRVRILSFSDIINDDQRYSVALNSDSIVEMDYLSAARYSLWLRRTCDSFISINHSYRRLSVNLLAALFFQKAERARKPWALRDGYFEDIFRFT